MLDQDGYQTNKVCVDFHICVFELRSYILWIVFGQWPADLYNPNDFHLEETISLS